MNKYDAVKLARECGLFIIDSDNDGVIIEGRDSDPKGLLAFANACEKIGMEKAIEDAAKHVKQNWSTSDSDSYGAVREITESLFDMAEELRAQKD